MRVPVVEVLVARIRKKFGSDAIANCRGQGDVLGA